MSPVRYQLTQEPKEGPEGPTQGTEEKHHMVRKADTNVLRQEGYKDMSVNSGTYKDMSLKMLLDCVCKFRY